MEKFRYYMKRLGRCFLFSHYATFMTFMISMISVQFFVDMKSRALALVLEIVVFLFYGFTEILTGMAFGTRQSKAKYSNAYQRTPDAPDLLGYYEKRDTEFAPANGPLIGLLSHYPLYLFLNPPFFTKYVFKMHHFSALLIPRLRAIFPARPTNPSKKTEKNT